MELDIACLSKQYKGNVWGLRDFSLNLRPGILGLLGPNGAGKSTLMRILATVSRPTSGSVHWNGRDTASHPDDLRRRLGYLPQDFGMYPHLSAEEFLQYIGAAKGLSGNSLKSRIDELLLLVNLHESRGRPVGGFSGGMRQRVGIAAALLNDPLLLIVDEPTAGLDPEERVRFRNLLTDLAGERIVILSTHIVSDIESSASRLAIIKSGRLLVSESPEQLLADISDKVYEFTSQSEKIHEYRETYLISGTMRRPDGIKLRIVTERTPPPDASRVVPTLEDVYLWHITAGSTKAAS